MNILGVFGHPHFRFCGSLTSEVAEAKLELTAWIETHNLGYVVLFELVGGVMTTSFVDGFHVGQGLLHRQLGALTEELTLELIFESLCVALRDLDLWWLQVWKRPLQGFDKYQTERIRLCSISNIIRRVSLHLHWTEKHFLLMID